MSTASFPLAGRSAIVTGANQGLGLEIARAYVRAGASVAICARDSAKLASATDALRAEAGDGQRVVARVVDVSRDAEVSAFVESVIAEFGRLHALVNNAGVYGPIGRIDEIDWAEWTAAMAININGSVLACRAVLPHFRQHGYGKIVQLSGGGATNPLPRISAYAASKAAIVRFAETLAEEVKDEGIDVNAIAPGALDTRLLDQVLEAGPERVGQAFYDKMRAVKSQGGTPLDRGAALAVFLASSASDGITGRLLSAVWDPWESLPALRSELAASDIYTLRRIVPRDRGKDWDES